jgi:hypothetical protein
MRWLHRSQKYLITSADRGRSKNDFAWALKIGYVGTYLEKVDAVEASSRALMLNLTGRYALPTFREMQRLPRTTLCHKLLVQGTNQPHYQFFRLWRYDD